MTEEESKLIPRALHMLTISIMVGFVMSSVLAIWLINAPYELQKDIGRVEESLNQLTDANEDRALRLNAFDEFMRRVDEGTADRWTASQEREWQEALFEANPQLKRPE